MYLYSRFLKGSVSLKEVREGSLSQSLRLVVFAGFVGLAVAQTPKFPADIDPVSMSRFPIVERAEMKTDADRAAYDYVVGAAPAGTVARTGRRVAVQSWLGRTD